MANSGFTGLLVHGAGPFKRLWLDLSDGKGNPHLGPHVIAGVNGSGKSTVLRALAWAVADPGKPHGFPGEMWSHCLHSGEGSSVAYWTVRGGPRGALASTHQAVSPFPPNVITSDEKYHGIPGGMMHREAQLGENFRYLFVRTGQAGSSSECEMLVAGYYPSRALKHLPAGEVALASDEAGEAQALSFDKTVANVVVHRWLQDLLSRISFAQSKGESAERERLMGVQANIERALAETLESPARLDVDIRKAVELRFRLRNQSLDFSQLPDGVRNLLGWIVDFARRMETADWTEESILDRPGVLLIDEVDAHLHPKWQRTVLPALRAAFPSTQIIVTTHSPFVISSCEDARIHVLDLNDDGTAFLKESMYAPIGDSVMATIKDVFGVSWYSVAVEKKLTRWSRLKKAYDLGLLPLTEESELQKLSDELSRTSAELALLVGHLGEPTAYDLPGLEK